MTLNTKKMLEGIEFLAPSPQQSLGEDQFVYVCQQYVENVEQRLAGMELSEKYRTRSNVAIYSLKFAINEMKKLNTEQSLSYSFAIFNALVSLNEVLLSAIEKKETN